MDNCCFALIVVIAILLVLEFIRRPRKNRSGMTSPQYDKKEQLRIALRELWDAHTDRTRFYILSALHDLPDKKYALDYLMRNQEDIGNAIGAYYGAEAGAQLTALLKDHIAIAGQIIDAVHKGNTQAIPGLDAQWEKNADQIAAFLASANPNWGLVDMQKMMRKHLELTTSEVLAHAQGRYLDDAQAFDKVVAEILMMSDMITAGIIAQFPSRF